MADASWIIFALLAAANMFLMTKTPPKVDFVLVRISALLWLAAGLSGLEGAVGRMLTSAMAGMLSAINKASSDATGTAIGSLLAFLLAVAWICAMLPDKTVKVPRTTFIVISGLMLPTLMAAIPGEAGDFLRGIVFPLGEFMQSLVTGWLS